MDRDSVLRVVLPMVTYVPGGMGGSETYARALIESLEARDDVDLTVLVSQAGWGSSGARHEVLARGLRGGASTGARLAVQLRSAWPDRGTRAMLRGADVVHYPFTVPVPRTRTPWVHSLLDVQHLDLPELFSFAERQYRRVTYDSAARRAARVITISEFSAGRISRHLGIPRDRIDVAPLGVDTDRFALRRGTRQPFVFYPASAWPHKNHGRLIEAMRLVRAERPEVKLVLTGGNAAALGVLPDWVEHRGYVSEDELAELYGTASCMAYPSMYEGFGLPVLEAMATGCPVAVSTSGSLPEVSGAAAVQYDALDVNGIAEGILEAMVAQPRRAALASQQVARYTWAACADAHVETYARVVTDSAQS